MSYFNVIHIKLLRITDEVLNGKRNVRNLLNKVPKMIFSLFEHCS